MGEIYYEEYFLLIILNALINLIRERGTIYIVCVSPINNDARIPFQVCFTRSTGGGRKNVGRECRVDETINH